MNIEFLYFEDCPSHEDALQRLRDVMQDEGITAEIAIIPVETDEAAQKHRFIGSPTIRVNGTDINPPADDTGYHLACRVYQWEDGRFSPMPSSGMIRSALQHVK